MNVRILPINLYGQGLPARIHPRRRIRAGGHRPYIGSLRYSYCNLLFTILILYHARYEFVHFLEHFAPLL